MATTNEAPRNTTARAGLPVPLWVLALTLATFATGTDDMIIAGILPTVSEDLNVSEATAGQLVTLYSFTYGIGAPVMAVLGSPACPPTVCCRRSPPCSPCSTC